MIDINYEKKKLTNINDQNYKQIKNKVLCEFQSFQNLQEGNITIQKQNQWLESMLNSKLNQSYSFKQNGRNDLYEEIQIELNIIKQYLSILSNEFNKQLNQEELKKIIVQLKKTLKRNFSFPYVLRYFSQKYPWQSKSSIFSIFQKIQQ